MRRNETLDGRAEHQSTAMRTNATPMTATIIRATSRLRAKLRASFRSYARLIAVMYAVIAPVVAHTARISPKRLPGAHDDRRPVTHMSLNAAATASDAV